MNRALREEGSEKGTRKRCDEKYLPGQKERVFFAFPVRYSPPHEVEEEFLGKYNALGGAKP